MACKRVWTLHGKNRILSALHTISGSDSLQVLLRLLKVKAAADHLAVLVGMDLSLHSLEVVNRLTTAAQLPQEFVHDYIVGCIASCERAQVRCHPTVYLQSDQRHAHCVWPCL